MSFDANLAFLLQSVQRVGRSGKIFRVRAEIAVMQIIDVDVIALEVLQRLLALVTNVKRIVCVLGRAGEPADFGGDDLAFRIDAQPIEDPRQHAFSPPVAVNISVVPMVHAGIQPSLDASRDLVFIHISPPVRRAIDPIQSPHRPAAKADFRNLHVRISELAVIHVRSSPEKVFDQSDLGL